MELVVVLTESGYTPLVNQLAPQIAHVVHRHRIILKHFVGIHSVRPQLAVGSAVGIQMVVEQIVILIHKIISEISYQFVGKPSPTRGIIILAHIIRELGSLSQLTVPQRLYIDSAIATRRARNFTLPPCVHPSVGIVVRQIALVVSIFSNRRVSGNLHILIYLLYEFLIAGIAQIIVNLHHKTRCAVRGVVKHSVKIQTVRHTSVGLGIRVQVLIFGKRKQNVARHIELPGTKHNARHCYEHITPPEICEPWKTGIDAPSTVLPCDQLVSSKLNPRQCVDQRLIIRINSILVEQSLHPVLALHKPFISVLTELIDQSAALFLRAESYHKTA